MKRGYLILLALLAFSAICVNAEYRTGLLTCFDPDGGISPQEAAGVTISDDESYTVVHDDECKDQYTLLEHHCLDDQGNPTQYISKIVEYDDQDAESGFDLLYSNGEVDCDHGCEDGRCVEGVEDPCDGVVCDAPPADECVDDSMLKDWSVLGVCVDGECSYGYETVDCDHGCEDGRCVEGVEDPCDGVVCDAPPADECVDQNILKTWSETGTCIDGQCSYTYNEDYCEYLCKNNRCTENPCNGMICNTPPHPECEDSKTLKRWDDGTCVVNIDKTSRCEYKLYKLINCPGGCLDGECIEEADKDDEGDKKEPYFPEETDALIDSDPSPCDVFHLDLDMSRLGYKNDSIWVMGTVSQDEITDLLLPDGTWTVAETDSYVPFGTTFFTSPFSTTLIGLPDGTKIQIYPNSEITITRAGDRINIEIGPSGGRIRLFHRIPPSYFRNSCGVQVKEVGFRSDMIISLPVAIAGVRGTDFTAAYDEDRNVSMFELYDGALEITNKKTGEKTTISTEYRAEIRRVDTTADGHMQKKIAIVRDHSDQKNTPMAFALLFLILLAAMIMIRIARKKKITKQ